MLSHPVGPRRPQFIDGSALLPGLEPAGIDRADRPLRRDPDQAAFAPGLTVATRPDDDLAGTGRPAQQVWRDIEVILERDRLSRGGLDQKQTPPSQHGALNGSFLGPQRRRLRLGEDCGPAAVRRNLKIPDRRRQPRCTDAVVSPDRHQGLNLIGFVR
ncbi:hypothetical protein D3C86_1701660 [compost metagenome]